MIVVIADDFTGASEIAGIAASYGLRAEVQTEIILHPDLDVIVIDTNTRSKTDDEAVEIISLFLEKLRGVKIELLFKKTDSVLRGHVYSELSIIQSFYPNKSVLLVPANPSMGKTISDGVYYINGRPIQESVFSRDPESPANDSRVIELLSRSGSSKIELLGTSDEIPSGMPGFFIADAVTVHDISKWSAQIGSETIPAGAADFFRSILNNMGLIKKENPSFIYDFDKSKSLIVCGSSLSNAANIHYEMRSKGPRVIEIFGDQICSDSNSGKVLEIAKTAIKSFEVTNNVILLVKIDENFFDHETHKLPLCLATVVRKVLKEVEVDELFIEGGSTSSEIVRKLGWTRFEPMFSVGEGIIRMKVSGLNCHVTVKPGSYDWPVYIWQNEVYQNQSN